MTSTVKMHLAKITSVSDLRPVLMLTNFSKETGNLGIFIHPKCFESDGSLYYNIAKDICNFYLKTNIIDEICLMYVGAVFNPNTSTVKDVNPSIVFQVQDVNGVHLFSYDFVEDFEGNVIVAPEPSITRHITDIATCTLPFIRITEFIK